MAQFLCKLTDDGCVKELFYRDGDTAVAVREEIEMFQWPQGSWEVLEACEEVEEASE